MRELMHASWRHSWAAVIIAALAAPVVGDAVADGPPRDEPAAEHSERGGDEAATREADPSRDHPEARHRDRPREEAREGDREHPEAREGDRRQQRREMAEQRNRLLPRAIEPAERLEWAREQARLALEAAERRVQQLREQGAEEALRKGLEGLESAKQRLRELDQSIRRFGEERERRMPDREGPPPDVQRRMEHLRIAVENLHAAGLHDVAERLMRELEPKVRGMADEPPPPEFRRPPAPEQFRGAVEDLNRQLDEMRRKMDEMRQHLERLTDEVHRRDR